MTETERTRLVVGLTGPLGSGVSSSAQALAGHGNFKFLSLSTAIKEELAKRENANPLNIKQIQDWRKKLQDIGNEKRQASPAYWVNEILNKIPSDKDVVIDGIRNTAEAIALRDRFPHFFLIAVIASPDVRWNRSQGEYSGNQRKFDEADRRDSEEDLLTVAQRFSRSFKP